VIRFVSILIIFLSLPIMHGLDVYDIKGEKVDLMGRNDTLAVILYHGTSCKKCIIDLGIALDSIRIDKCAIAKFIDDFAQRRELERIIQKYLPKVEVFYDRNGDDSIFKRYYNGKSPTMILIYGDTVRYYNFKESEYIWTNRKLP
jgi:hypothetical protein